MSQEQKPERKLSDILKERIDKIETENKALKTTLTLMEAKISEPKPKIEEKPEAGVPDSEVSHLGHVLGCKDCNKELKTSLKDLVECEGCGSIVRKSEPGCPFCKGKRAKLI